MKVATQGSSHTFRIMPDPDRPVATSQRGPTNPSPVSDIREPKPVDDVRELAYRRCMSFHAAKPLRSQYIDLAIVFGCATPCIAIGVLATCYWFPPQEIAYTAHPNQMPIGGILTLISSLIAGMFIPLWVLTVRNRHVNKATLQALCRGCGRDLLNRGWVSAIRDRKCPSCGHPLGGGERP